MQKQLIEDLVVAIQNTNQFKQIFKNVVPVWTNIRNFPAVAVLYESEEKLRDNLTNRKAFYTGHISIFVFNEQVSSNQYEDVLSGYIETIYNVVENMRWNNYNIIDMTISSMKRDGGIIHPFAVAKIDIEVKYIKAI